MKYKTPSRPSLVKNCIYCNSEFRTFASREGKYCRRQCYFDSGDIQKIRIGKKHNAETIEKLRKDGLRKDSGRASAWFKPGHKAWDHPNVKRNWIKKGTRPSNYKGGYRKKWDVIKDSKEYRDWRKAVFVRDRYTCVFCNAYGVDIHADHIKPKAQFEELTFDVDNGRTLCVPCHMKTPTWGTGRL